MSFEVLGSQSEAAVIVSRFVGIDVSQPIDTRFEIMRATVWSLAASIGKAHVNRLLSAALPTWKLLSRLEDANEESLRSELRAALSMLQDAGDLLELKGGYWAAASTRLVELPQGYLLVSGIPTNLLPDDFERVEHHGPYRHTATRTSEFASALAIESLAAWAKLPTHSSQDRWASETIASIELQPYAPTGFDDFEFYFPARSNAGAPQFKRWFGDVGDFAGRLLARRTRVYGAREYRLVEVRSGQLVGAGGLHGVDVRRLMYALDRAAGNPVRVRQARQEGRATWLLSSELPRAEQRLFAAFGTVRVPPDRPFERQWTFERNEDMALDMLRALGIALVSQQPKSERQ